ncbi:MAG: hypothetical protein QNL12_00920 [Acidimicrobiia bacterium]|nr:hypothetical protein [Acidimicrobiia bacterium]MDX2465847.1 hypothetical protein [Acidimicrobiia bacterium]
MSNADSPLGQWLRDIFVGGVAGLLIGMVLAVNIVIFSGIDGGYEASPAEVFAENPIVGTVAAIVLAGAPIAGIAWLRRRRASSGPH